MGRDAIDAAYETTEELEMKTHPVIPRLKLRFQRAMRIASPVAQRNMLTGEIEKHLDSEIETTR